MGDESMDYWDILDLVKQLVPRTQKLFHPSDLSLKRFSWLPKGASAKQKGRKKNYREFNLLNEEFMKRETPLPANMIKSIVQLGLPEDCSLPLNADVWDGVKCPYRCIYCFADSFRSTLYPSLFDLTESFRYSRPESFKQKLDKYIAVYYDKSKARSPIEKAFSIGIPIRFGIHFENFTALERKKGVALEFLKHLSSNQYPVCVNTKSVLVAEDKYIDSLRSNKGGSWVHISLITSNDRIGKILEPGAPLPSRRFQALKRLTEGGVQAIARLHPYIPLYLDNKELFEEYVEMIKDSGVKKVTLDTWMLAVDRPGIVHDLENVGIDYSWLHLTAIPWISDLLVGGMIREFQKRGIMCSSPSVGVGHLNSEFVCCGTTGSKFNPMSWMAIAKVVKDNVGKPITWKTFMDFVEENGGFLSEQYKGIAIMNWNLLSVEDQCGRKFQIAHSHTRIPYIRSVGVDENGFQIWIYDGSVRNRFLDRLIEMAGGGR